MKLSLLRSVACRNASSAVGWAISMGEALRNDVAYVHNELFKRTMSRLPGVDPRLVTGYTVCLYFAEKVIVQ